MPRDLVRILYELYVDSNDGPHLGRETGWCLRHLYELPQPRHSYYLVRLNPSLLEEPPQPAGCPFTPKGLGVRVFYPSLFSKRSALVFWGRQNEPSSIHLLFPAEVLAPLAVSRERPHSLIHLCRRLEQTKEVVLMTSRRR